MTDAPRPPLVPPSPSIPEVPQLPSAKERGGTARDPKDAFQDPNSKHYLVELFVGTGSAKFSFACASDLSAAMGAFFLALRHQPEVHTFGVWRKADASAEAQLEDTICFVALAQMMASCGPTIQGLTGKQITSPAVPVLSDPSGFEELQRKLKEQKRRPS